MNDSVYEFKVVVHERKVLRLRSQNRRDSIAVYGPEILYGTKKEVGGADEPELWIVIPKRRNFGLDPDDVLNVHWDKIAKIYIQGEDGIERPMFP